VVHKIRANWMKQRIHHCRIPVKVNEKFCRTTRGRVMLNGKEYWVVRRKISIKSA
jgi:predicted transposase YbfD/YdcC